MPEWFILDSGLDSGGQGKLPGGGEAGVFDMWVRFGKAKTRTVRPGELMLGV